MILETGVDGAELSSRRVERKPSKSNHRVALGGLIREGIEGRKEGEGQSVKDGHSYQCRSSSLSPMLIDFLVTSGILGDGG